MRGGRYPASGADNSGFGAQTLFAHAGGDVGDSSSWLAGVSFLHANSKDRAAGEANNSVTFNGKSNLLIAELIWKWAPHGNWKQRNFADRLIPKTS